MGSRFVFMERMADSANYSVQHCAKNVLNS